METKKSCSAQNTDSCYDVDAAFCLVGAVVTKLLSALAGRKKGRKKSVDDDEEVSK